MKHKIIFAIIFVCALLAVGGYAVYNSNSANVKTDPEFYEIKGKVIEGFPTDFPSYPGVKLVGSANVNPKNVPDEGYRIKWELEKSSGTVPEIMQWYGEELTKAGWTFTPPDDPEAYGEQIGYISSEALELKGYIAVEIEDEHIEIIVDVRKD